MKRILNTKLSILATCLSLAAVHNSSYAEIPLYDENNHKLDLIIDLQGGLFLNSNSNFGNSREFIGENTDSWQEFAGEIGLAGETSLFGGTLFGSFTGVYTRTWEEDASGIQIGTSDEDTPDLFRTEQAHIGWRSGDSFSSLDTDAITIKAGRFDYVVGTGLLIADGGGDGGERGGWWIGARKTFSDAFLASFDHGPFLIEAFRLKNQARIDGVEGKGLGTNIEYEFTPANLTTGFTFINTDDTGDDDSDFENFNTYSYRLGWAPTDNMQFDAEYVEQSKNNADGEAWYVQGKYVFSDVKWSPEISYRYADLSGDDLDTDEDERFNPLAYGFTDYGTWYQGEITGNYPLENSNLDSHMVRLQMFPTDSLTLNFLYYNFKLDEKQIFGTPVSSDDFGDEINISADWAVNDNTFFIGTYGVLFPDDAAEEFTGGDDDWHYLMLYINYTF